MARKIAFGIFSLLLLLGVIQYQRYFSSCLEARRGLEASLHPSNLLGWARANKDPNWAKPQRTPDEVRKAVWDTGLLLLNSPATIKDRLDVKRRTEERKTFDPFDAPLGRLDPALQGALFYAVNSKPVPASRAVPITASMRGIHTSSGYSGYSSSSSYHK